jgi:hypothetical protein
MTVIPELESHCGSWIVTRPDGFVFELFERENVQIAANRDWRIETAAQYLGRINKAIREKQS